MTLTLPVVLSNYAVRDSNPIFRRVNADSASDAEVNLAYTVAIYSVITILSKTVH